MRERRTIAIAGAGIGGLTAALALARAGFAVTLAERAAALSEVGAGIQISPNAGRVLAQLGLEEAIAARATEPEAIVVRSGSHGGTLATIAATEFRRRYGLPYRVMHRAYLQAVLLEAVRAEPAINLRLGAETSAPGDADAMIAADGVWSSHRDAMPGAARAVPSERTAWRATVPAAALPEGARSNAIGLWLGPGAHLVHYPVRQGTAVNIVAIVEDARNNDRAWNAPGDPALLAGRFAGWADAPQAIVAASPTWQTFAIATVNSDGPWVSGKTALLGDAAHAMLPFLAQGAAMAIEDAAVVASALSASDDVTAALAAYERERKQRVARVAAASARTGAWYHATGARALARDAALRIGSAALVLGTNDWIYRWRPPEEPRLITPMRRSSQ